MTWCEDNARPLLESLFASSGLLAELDASYNRILTAPVTTARRVNAMLHREYDRWDRRLGEVITDLTRLKKLALPIGSPVVLDTSALMEGKPFSTFDWHSLDSALAGVPIRLIVPLLVVEELDELLHDRDGNRKKKARDATRALWNLHKTDPTEPAPMPAGPDVTIEVLVEEDWRERRPNNDAEIIDQAVAFRDMTGKDVHLAACDLRMVYRAGAVGLPALLVPRADGYDPGLATATE